MTSAWIPAKTKNRRPDSAGGGSAHYSSADAAPTLGPTNPLAPNPAEARATNGFWRQLRLLDQHRVAELVRAEAVAVHHRCSPLQRRVRNERSQELEVTRSGFVGPGQQRVHDAEPIAPRDAVVGNAPARGNAAVQRCRMLERAHDRRADRDDATLRMLRSLDRASRRRRDRIRLIQGKPRIEEGSPVDDRPAACVSVAKRTPRSRRRPSVRQSMTKPADGGSIATGGPAIGVCTSQASIRHEDARTGSAVRGARCRSRRPAG